MPQDPNLYGQRASKRQKKETTLPSSLAFSAELSSLISTSKSSGSNKNNKTCDPSSSSEPHASSAAARPRPSKAKTTDIFAGVRARKKNNNDHDVGERDKQRGKLVLREVHGTQDEKDQLAAARRKMEEKARLYAAMKRGDYVPREGESSSLVDFDRKWAEAHQDDDGNASSSSDDDDHDDDADAEIIEYTDEFGRTRRGTRADRLREERRARAAAHGAAELEHMAVRPRAPAPDKIIYGDAVQADAFRAVDEDAMAALARKRDRSLTPPPAQHYDAAREIRTKGVGFFQFSRDEDARAREMAGLAAERAATARARQEREEEKQARKKEIEERRRLVEERRREAGEKRARRLADSFLDGLAADLGGGGGGADGGGDTGTTTATAEETKDPS